MLRLKKAQSSAACVLRSRLFTSSSSASSSSSSPAHISPSLASAISKTIYPTKTPSEWMTYLRGTAITGLPQYMGFEPVECSEGRFVARIIAKPFHMAPLNGFMHAGSQVTLADTTAGFGCGIHLPKGAYSFTTVELKSNFFSTAKVGDEIQAEATLAHGGKSTQVWDVTVKNMTEHGKTMSLFRCTQIMLYHHNK